MLYSIITTIQEPTASVHGLVARLAATDGKLIVAGDTKGPFSFEGPPGEPWPVIFLSIEDQQDGRFSLAENLPTKHYARKNIAYLDEPIDFELMAKVLDLLQPIHNHNFTRGLPSNRDPLIA